MRSPGGAGGRAGALRQQAGAEVAPGDQRVGGGGGERGAGERQQQHPPAVLGERPDLLHPADRGEPADPGRAGVADGPQHEGGAEQGAGEAVGGAGGAGQLGGDGGGAGEEQAAAAEGESEGEGAGRGLAGGGETAGDQGREQQVGGGGGEQRGGERSAPADRAGADQFEPAVLLLGAGVPDDQQGAHQSGEDGAEDGHPPGRQPADGGRVVQRAVQGAQRGVGGDAGGEAEPGVLGVVQRAEGERGGDDRGGEDVDPGGQRDAVAAQREAQQDGGAGEGVHRATAGSDCSPRGAPGCS
nr:hypothetical protein [Streptomyces sp. TLI_235]